MTIEIKQSSTTYPLVFLMVDSTDHVTGKTGLTPTVTLSKAGAAFGAAAGAVTEISSGWYKVAGNATDNNTLGPLILHATGTAADPTDVVFNVTARLADDLAYPTVSGRSLDVSATGEAGIDWANVGSPTTALALTGTTIATTQKVDVETIKTNPVVNAGTVTFPTTATLASTTNITAGTVTTATNVTTVNGLAAGVITATSIAADAITAAKIADGAIDAATFAAGAINAAAIAADAITAAKIADGAIDSATFAAGAINAAAIAADAITDAKVAADVTIASVTGAVGSVTGAVGSVTGAVGSVTGAVGSVTGNVGGNVTGSVGSVVGAVGSVTGNVGGNVVGSVASVTAAVSLSAGDSPVMQSGTATAGAGSTITIQTALGDDSLPVGCVIKITGGTGANQARVITTYVNATKVVTVDRAWTTNPDATSVYSILYAEAPALSTGLKVTGVVLTDTLTTYTGNTPQTGDAYARLGAPAGASVSADVAAVKTDTAAVKTKTDFLPSATAGAAGGVFIAGTNAATTITTALTTTFTGNLTGSVGSVTGAVGSVTGAVGSVTGNVGGNVSGSVGSVTGNVGGNVTGSVGSVATGGIAAASFAAGAIDAAAIANDAIGALELAAGAASEIATAVRTELTTELGRIDVPSSTLATAANLATVDTVVDAIKVTTDKLDDTVELTSDGYIFTANALEQAPSGSGASASAIADEVQTRTIAAVTLVNGLAANTVTASVLAADAVTEIQSGLATAAALATVDDFLDTEIADIQARLPAALVSGRMDASVGAMAANVMTAAAAAADLTTELQSGLATAAALSTVEGKIDTVDGVVDAIKAYADRTVIRGTVDAGASTTSFTAASLSPAGASVDQFKGRIIVFDNATSTAGLRGEATDITANTGAALPLFTFSALTDAPASGDSFSVV